MYIGNDAQAAIQRSQRGYGGQVYLDDGRCSGWFTVAPDQGAPAQQARASSGSICALVSTIGNRAGVAAVPVRDRDGAGLHGLRNARQELNDRVARGPR